MFIGVDYKTYIAAHDNESTGNNNKKKLSLIHQTTKVN
jgi:hypothetical protein